MNPLAHTHRVAIELSNFCPLASLHKQCPLSLGGKPVVLPSEMIYGILGELGRLEFSGYISFHRYNEPLADPRLYLLLAAKRRHCPGAGVYICTSGYFLTERSYFELYQEGVSEIHVSLYSSPGRWAERVAQLEAWKASYPTMKMSWSGGLWEGLLDLYDSEPKGCTLPCHAPLGEVVITKDGDVGLCCRDWKNQHTFGNLRDHSLAEILASDEVQDTHRRLSAGERFLDLCSRCKSSRGV